MARARWGTRRVLLTRASLFAGDAVLLHHAVEVVAIGAREARGFAHVVLCALEQGEHVALLEGVDGCCARATTGHAAAAPPSSVMNSRRLIIRSPRRRERAARATRPGRASWLLRR